MTSRHIRRIMIDYKELINDPLPNIYYIQDENNILNGYALIIGPENTPYEYGNYLFEFKFPENYPFSPPTVKFITGDGFTRFNPNLYINGTVCLSILNTWNGEKWSACQSIRTVLLTLATVLNEHPLLNEPELTDKHPDYHTYNELIEYKNIEISIIKYLEKTNLPYPFHSFYSKIIEHFKQNYQKIYDKIENKPTKRIIISIYNQNSTLLNYKQLSNMLKLVYDDLHIKE
jgi:ubiquitin-conjugating enzyme E2 Z